MVKRDAGDEHFAAGKENTAIDLPIFFDRYDYVRTIFESAATKIYVVNHRLMDEERIMKVIPREKSDGAKLLQREASILKILRHPGIPVLYDYGEDDECICIIEEYVRGLSLQEYFLYHPRISSEQIISYVTALCEILEYLHSDPVRIVYRDLKPEHIMIREDRIMLIDYGISEFLTRSCHTHSIAGTPDYMAPESLAGISDEKNDIYALGAVARQMLAHCDSPDAGRLLRLAEQALMPDPKARPGSIAEWKMQWKSHNEIININGRKDNAHHLKKIAVIGTNRGIGCTHIAISLVCYLNHIGRGAIYENNSGEAVCENILSYGREFRENKGLIYHGSFTGVVSYFAAKVEQETPLGIFVLDCGSDTGRYAEADIVLYIMSSRLWKMGDVDSSIASLSNCYTLINPQNMGVGIALARQLGRKVYSFPQDPDPFHITAEKKRLFEQIFGRMKNDIWTKD